MFTLEQKVDLVMQYIATADKKLKGELKKAIIEALNSEGDTGAPDVVSRDTVIDDMIFALLKKVGMPAHLKGYNYTNLAIKLCLADPDYLDQITKRLYPDVAKAYATKPSRVERAIRHSIEVVFDRGDVDDLMEIFGYTVNHRKGKLTNGEFIASCCNEIKHALKG